MAAIGRTALILVAFVLGNFVAANVLSLGKIFVDPSNFHFYSKWDYVGGGLPGYILHTVFAAITSMILTFIPTLFVLIFLETFRIRTVWFYTLTGGLGAFLFDVACTRFGIIGMRSFCVEESFSELFIATIAGVAAGYVFWRMAGHRAGMWRKEMPSIPPLAA